MKRYRLFACVIVLFIGSCFTPSPSWARELKVLDEAGMVRSVKEVEKAATVIVRLSGADGKLCKLVRVDGVAQERQTTIAANSALFPKVKPGVWRVVFPPSQIRSIRITKK